MSYNPLDSHHTKPNFGITRYAIVLVVSNDANSCFCPIFRILNRAANYVEPSSRLVYGDKTQGLNTRNIHIKTNRQILEKGVFQYVDSFVF